MTGKKMSNLRIVLCCVLFASAVLVNDVDARATKFRLSRSSGHSGSFGHSSHSSHSVSAPHSTHSSSGPVTQHKFSQSHSYPSSHQGVSGGSTGHGYPSSPSHSLSGSSGSSSHSYPSSNSLSGSGSHYGSISHPSSNFGASGSSHSYPSSPSHSLSGGSSGTSSHNYPSSNSMNIGGSVHSYPNSGPSSSLSGGSSGSSVHSYPSTNTLSGSGSRTGTTSVSSSNFNVHFGNTASGTNYPSSNSYPNTNTHQSTSWGSNRPVQHVHTNSHTVVHHHHYDYRPPNVIHFSSSHGMTPVSYPVYTGVPPPYVYEYRSSGNKYRQLLAGLALYNLGRVSATSNSHHYHKTYIPQPDEYCKFGVQYRSGHFEEMGIDCRAITYFIYETQPQTQNFISTNILNQPISMTQSIFPNGTLVTAANAQNMQVSPGIGGLSPYMQEQANAANALVPNTQQIMNAFGKDSQVFNTLTTTTQTVSVTDPRFAGHPVQVSPDMECYVTRSTRFTNMKKSVPCALLEQYAVSSLRRSSAAMIKSSLTIMMMALAFLLY